MALLAENIVEKWLNHDRRFTIRGAKLEVYEIDILAVKLASGRIESLQVETGGKLGCLIAPFRSHVFRESYE